MVRDIGALTAEAFRRVTRGTWLWLLYLETRNPTTGELEAYRFASHGETFRYGKTAEGADVLWYPAPFAPGDILEEGDGSIPAIPITIANVRDDLIEKLIERDFLEGQRAVLIQTNTSAPPESGSELRFEGAIGDVEATEDAITFAISSAPLFELEAPQTSVVEDGCGNVYGADGCEFPIETLDPDLTILGPCQKRLVDCRARRALAIAEGHTPVLWPLNFSAEPGVEDS